MEYQTIDDAVKELKLDRRRKYMEFMGELIVSESYTTTCSGCDGGGCRECGYKGKRKSYYPVSVFDKSGNFIKIKPSGGEHNHEI